MDDVDERDLLLARRLKLAVRLVIYPLLLGLVALAWHTRRGRADEASAFPAIRTVRPVATSAPRTTLTARAQGGRLTLRLGGRTPMAAKAVMPMRCADGTTFTFRWRADEFFWRGAPPVFTSESVGRAGTASDGHRFVYDAHLRLRGGPPSTARLDGVVRWWRDRGSVECRWSAPSLTLAKG
jgi:hypothetical protein